MSRREELRRFRRWDCILPCRCEGDDFRGDGVVVNLSCGGAGITGTKNLPEESTKLLLTIRPHTENVQVQAKVAWVNPATQKLGQADFGVEFTESAEDTKKKLRRFLPSTLEW